MNSFYKFSIILLVIALASCKSKSKIIPTELHEKNFYRNILKNYNRDFQTFSAKANVKYRDSYDSVAGKLYIRMNQDSLWMVAKKLGVEGMRLLLTSDSIFMINRQERTYLRKDFSALKYEFNIAMEFNQLRAMMAGNILFNSQQEDLNAEIDSLHYLNIQNEKSLLVKHLISLNSLELIHSNISDNLSREVHIKYGNYQDLDNKQTAFKRSYILPSSEYGNLDLSLDLSNIEFDIPVSMPFSIPSHYEKIN